MDKLKEENIYLGIVWEKEVARDWTPQERDNILQIFFDLDWNNDMNTLKLDQWIKRYFKEYAIDPFDYNPGYFIPIWTVYNDKVIVIFIKICIWEIYQIRKNLLKERIKV